MDALEALQQRVSVSRLGGDVPSDEVLENIFQAALRAPDHALLTPWRFLKIAGDGRNQLGELFAEAQLQADPALTEAKVAKAKSKPLRAPLIVVAIATVAEHASVPEVEQLLSVGAATQNMLLAAYAQGLGAMWRTGGMAYHPLVLNGLGLTADEKLIGYLYIGQVEGKTRLAPKKNTVDYFKSWPAIN
ncbi:MAG: nitroreductase [Pseudomonadales bacterium]|nr:nitroreductase [Pseudomonadales bacterium]